MKVIKNHTKELKIDEESTTQSKITKLGTLIQVIVSHYQYTHVIVHDSVRFSFTILG